MIRKLLPCFAITFVLLSSFFKVDYCKLSDRILHPYMKQLRREKSLYLGGCGGSMMADVKMVGAYLVGFHELSVDAARELFVEINEELIARYNNNEQIRPFLHNYPFSIDNIEIHLAFEDEYRKIQSHGYVAGVFIGKNQEVYYEGYDHEKHSFYDLHSESYADAVAIVKARSMSNQ